MQVRILSALLGLALLGAGPADAESPKPLRHLVYNFDFNVNQDMAVDDSGIGSGVGMPGQRVSEGNGMTHYRAGDDDRGTVTVDVMAVQPDAGLVVYVSEQAQNRRSAAPAMCVVYGIGTAVCDNRKKLNQEEMVLLRVMGRNFINASMLDAKHHWFYALNAKDGKETNDFTIVSERGGVYGIEYRRVLTVHGPQPYTATTSGQLTYNGNSSLPTLIKEETVTRENAMSRSNRLDQQITLALSSDSMAAAKTP